jgi:hypothetical protein
MIARHRGDQRIHSRWRPVGAATTRAPAPRTQAEHLDEREHDELDQAEGRQRQWPTYPIHSRRSWALIAVVAAIVVAVVASQHQARQASGAPLPSTPLQWVEQWTAASLDNPGRVCRQLFAPALAGVFKADTGRSCLDYYNDVNAKSFRIRHVLVDGNAAAVEVREVGLRPNWGYVTMILSHVEQGWQAVDIVPGGPVRPR